MGKWDRRNYARPRRRYYRDYNWSPPRDGPCPDPEFEVWQDNVPMWEKKFCYLVGRMPWKKVLSTKNFMHCHNNVLTWDDSAGEEAFINAKTRFWNEFNGLPSESQPPNPDMYIEEINWNPYIDPDLTRELDRVYFNPDDKYHLPSTSSPKENDGSHEDNDNPWERGCSRSRAVQEKPLEWNHHDDCVDDMNKLIKKNNPWESHNTKEAEIKDNSWGGAWNNSDRNDTSSKWKPESSGWKSEGTGWHDRRSYSRNWNQNSRDSFKSGNQNNNYRAQEFGSHVQSRGFNGRSNQWGQQWSGNNNSEVRGSGNVYRGRGRYTSGCRKREGSDHHGANFKGPRIQGSDYQSPRFWNAENNKRVSFGGRWS
ncbi:hypothetical protein vseg_008748 [Gypsophila vaccaria]